MNNTSKTTQDALKSLISSKLPSLKICFRKSFHNKYADQWAKEEAKIDALAQELKTGLNQGDSKRIQEAVGEWKAYLMLDSSWKSERISEMRQKSFLNTSDGRFYGGAMTDFMMLLKKIDNTNASGSFSSKPVANSMNSAEKESNMSNIKTTNMLKITNPITGDELQVANQDFSDRMNWQDAKRACSELGSGWRLPTKQELEIMYKQLHKKGQGNFKSVYYWSSSEDDGLAWVFSFNDGYANYPSSDKDDTNYVRAVRAL